MGNETYLYWDGFTWKLKESMTNTPPINDVKLNC